MSATIDDYELSDSFSFFSTNAARVAAYNAITSDDTYSVVRIVKVDNSTFLFANTNGEIFVLNTGDVVPVRIKDDYDVSVNLMFVARAGLTITTTSGDSEFLETDRAAYVSDVPNVGKVVRYVDFFDDTSPILSASIRQDAIAYRYGSSSIHALYENNENELFVQIGDNDVDLGYTLDNGETVLDFQVTKEYGIVGVMTTSKILTFHTLDGAVQGTFESLTNATYTHFDITYDNNEQNFTNPHYVSVVTRNGAGFVELHKIWNDNGLTPTEVVRVASAVDNVRALRAFVVQEGVNVGAVRTLVYVITNAPSIFTAYNVEAGRKLLEGIAPVSCMGVDDTFYYGVANVLALSAGNVGGLLFYDLRAGSDPLFNVGLLNLLLAGGFGVVFALPGTLVRGRSFLNLGASLVVAVGLRTIFRSSLVGSIAALGLSWVL